MHLHDVLRLWHAELATEQPLVAIVEDDMRNGRGVLEGAPREALPGRLRRDDPAALPVRLLPARHDPAPPASDDALDALEAALGFDLPRGIELLLRLHNGGDFFRPTSEGLEAPLNEPLRVLSAEAMAAAYGGLLETIRDQLGDIDADADDLFRMSRRFGHGRNAHEFADCLGAVYNGAKGGLKVIPLARPPSRPDDLVVYVPEAGDGGRVGYVSAEAGFLPDHSDDLAFNGIEGWLVAVIRGRACQRVVLT
ncbi:MAG: SMI1/KNR4 family protein [Proteobacteria bacterium]|nr:SMI1/KNR4 family protein [Pseudomonadota bacterium]